MDAVKFSNAIQLSPKYTEAFLNNHYVALFTIELKKCIVSFVFDIYSKGDELQVW